MNKTNVRDAYEAHKNNFDEYSFEICAEILKKEASSNPIEFTDLINLFNEEQDEYFKLLTLAEALIFLKWKPVTKYLYQIMNFDKDFGNKIIATSYLVDFGDKKICNYIAKFLKEAKQSNDSHYFNEIVRIFTRARTPKIARLFVKLEKLYPEFKDNLFEKDYKKIHKLAKK